MGSRKKASRPSRSDVPRIRVAALTEASAGSAHEPVMQSSSRPSARPSQSSSKPLWHASSTAAGCTLGFPSSQSRPKWSHDGVVGLPYPSPSRSVQEARYISSISSARSSAIFRLVKFLSVATPEEHPLLYRWLYWIIFSVFLAMMYHFVSPTLDKSFTVLALIAVTFIMLTPTNYRLAVLIFIAGTGLGYFFERWGTTRHCWNDYTGQTPPPFSVLAHGLAAVAFWRAERYLRMIANVIMGKASKVSDREIWG